MFPPVGLGPDVPIASLAEAVSRERPRLVWLSITSLEVKPRFFDHVPEFFEAARAARAAGARVMLGGQGLTPALADRLVAAAFGTRLAHLPAFAQGLR